MLNHIKYIFSSCYYLKLTHCYFSGLLCKKGWARTSLILFLDKGSLANKHSKNDTASSLILLGYTIFA